jgi:alkylation response protein AidB-like acyl-CoA dehydrogenase
MAHDLSFHPNAHLSEVGRFVARTATEVHGGMGFTDLLGLHYWFERIGFNRQILGAPGASAGGGGTRSGIGRLTH